MHNRMRAKERVNPGTRRVLSPGEQKGTVHLLGENRWIGEKGPGIRSGERPVERQNGRKGKMVKQRTKSQNVRIRVSIVPGRIGREIRVVPFLVKKFLFSRPSLPPKFLLLLLLESRIRWRAGRSVASPESMIDREKTVESAWTKITGFCLRNSNLSPFNPIEIPNFCQLYIFVRSDLDHILSKFPIIIFVQSDLFPILITSTTSSKFPTFANYISLFDPILITSYWNFQLLPIIYLCSTRSFPNFDHILSNTKFPTFANYISLFDSVFSQSWSHPIKISNFCQL